MVKTYGLTHVAVAVRDVERAVRKAGGRVKEVGRFVPGEPCLFATDPDGYEIEIWFERPTPVDPPARRR